MKSLSRVRLFSTRILWTAAHQAPRSMGFSRQEHWSGVPLLVEFCQENALVIANTLFQQHKRRLCTWTSPDDQHQNQIDYILCSQRWRSTIQSAKARLGADCGSDHELLIAKFRLKLKRVGKTTRPDSVQCSHSVMSDSLRPHESQHARPPCSSPTPGVHSDSRPSSQ